LRILSPTVVCGTTPLPTPEIIDRLIDAAFTRAARDGWVALSMAEIAADAGLSVAETFAAAPSKTAILDALLRRVEDRMLADAAPDFAESPRDRLFELVMLRFDALSPYRLGLGSLLRDLPADPVTALSLLPGLGSRLARVLEAAGVSTGGILGFVRVNGFALIYLDALRAWIDDDSPDMAKTMAVLDRGLRRADSLMHFAGGLLPPRLRPAAREEDGGEPPASDPGDDATAGMHGD
jgi:AcrR family transcriptional regulator